MVLQLNSDDSEQCILSEALKIISKKWTAFIFCQLLTNETMNFKDLLDLLTNGCGKKISPSVLSQTLKELGDHDLLVKKTLSDYVPIRTEYQLTNKGKELRLIYGIIKEWALKWFNKEQMINSNVLDCCVLEILPEIKSKTDSVLK